MTLKLYNVGCWADFMRNWSLEVPESVDARIQVSFAVWNIAVLGSGHSGNSLLV